MTRWNGHRRVTGVQALRMVAANLRMDPEMVMAGRVMIRTLGCGWWLAVCSVCNAMVESKDLAQLTREAGEHSAGCSPRPDRTGGDVMT